MAVDKKAIQSALNKLQKSYGEGSVYSLDEKNMGLLNRWSTGIEQLDSMLGGGFASGRIYEIFGAESAGKTSLAYHLMARHELALDIPIEGTFDIERAEMFGNKDGQLMIRNCETGEQVFETIDRLAEQGIPIIVVDSIPSMITEKEFELDDYTKEPRPGRIAALMSQRLPKTKTICERTGTTLIFINQLRDKMNAMPFQADDHTSGGRAKNFYSSARLKVARMKWIEIPNKDPLDSSKNKAITQKTTFA